MKLTDEQLMDILKEAIKAIAIKYNSIVTENEETVVTERPVTKEVAPKENPKTVEEPTKVAPKEDIKTSPMPSDTKPVDATVEEPNPQVNRKVLEAMTYNEIKVLAKENGVKAIGNKQSLIDKILEAQASSVDPNSDMTTEEVEEEQPQEEVVEGYIATPKEDVEYDEEEYEEEPIEDEEEHDLYTKLVRETMDMSDEEIADLLADVGKSPKGKRQALLAKLEEAVREGLISLDDEDDQEEDTTQQEEEVVEEDVKEEPTVEEVEIAGSEERVAKVEELYETYISQYENEEISLKDVQDFLKDYYNESNDYATIVETYTEEEMVEHYALIHAQLVDDEGVEYDWGEPYVVDDEYWCSGKPMKYLDENTLYDEVTGEKFDLQ